MNTIDLLCITGPTASGKTSFAANLAYYLEGEIISADSRQVYRKMDIGTGKDYQDYMVDNVCIPCHLIDIHEPGYHYNLYEFQKDFLTAYRLIRAKNKFPILAGGTGLYIQAVIEGYQLAEVPANETLRKDLENHSQEELAAMLYSLNPHLHNTTDTLNRKRTIRAIEIASYGKITTHHMAKPDSLVIGIFCEGSERRKKITERLKRRLKEGLIGEVEALLEIIPAENLIYYGLEYKYVTQYLTGRMEKDEMFTKLEIAIHQFAKRQMTWFRQMEKRGHIIHWVEGNLSLNEKLNFVFHLLKEKDLAHLIRKKW